MNATVLSGKKVMIIFGTRPEALKMCPLVCEMKKHTAFETKVCVTEQHREMLHQVLSIFGVEPDMNLHIMQPRQTLTDVTTRLLSSLTAYMSREKPDLIYVHGDTVTAYASALAGFYLQIPVAHVEAGLRTNHIYSPFPEEFYRRSISQIAAIHFAPTQRARENLLREGIDENRIFVTGNTGIDALRVTVRANYQSPITQWAEGSRLLVITAHRRENLGEHMTSMFRAIRHVVEAFPDVKAVYPVHLNPAVREIAERELGGCADIRLIDPLGPIDFHNLMAKAELILTDSGGIQEEAPSLGKPVLVMRDTTERPEGIEAGTLRLVGTEEDSIFDACSELLTDRRAYEQMSHAANPYGDGYASRRIAEISEKMLQKNASELLPA